MLKTIQLPAPIKSLSITQRLLVLVVGLVVLFIIIGSATGTADSGPFNFGIQAQPFPVLAILAFGAGILSFVSPCTLPVLSAYFAFAFQSDRSRIAANTLAFMLGLATTFSLFGAAGFALGRVLLQNQQLILLVGGAFVVGFGVMSLLGNGFGGVSPTTNTDYGTTVQGSYFFGLTFAVGWTSCVGPILGTVLTLAAQTSSVWRGMMLLFIYSMGLGLPLMLVSTLFGRASRKSLFWRILKGKGWEWDTSLFVVALVWALAIWRILVAFTEYAFRNFSLFDGQTFTPIHEYGLLVIAVLGALLWVFTSPGERRTLIHLHSTQIISGALFILIGLLMLDGRLSYFSSLISPEFAARLATWEDWLVRLAGG